LKTYLTIGTVLILLLLSNCSYAARPLPGIDPVVQELFDKTKNLFIYKSDDELYSRDKWVSHIDKVKSKQYFKGDCDDFALTLYDLLIERGYSPVFYIVKTPRNYHAVLWVNGMIIDNTLSHVVFWNAAVTYHKYDVVFSIDHTNMKFWRTAKR